MRSVTVDLERLSPEDRIAWAVDQWGDRLLFTSSFGAGSGVLLHMWSKVARHLPVVFLDTGFLFDETLRYRDLLAQRFGLEVTVVRPASPSPPLHETDPDACCARNKVEPLAPYLARAGAWVSGLRRDQSATRADTPILMPTDEGYVKLHPLATMTRDEAAAYMIAHDIPEHPLRAHRYLSIGCAPCTSPVAEGEEDDERAGRWRGRPKTECGIHRAVWMRGST